MKYLFAIVLVVGVVVGVSTEVVQALDIDLFPSVLSVPTKGEILIGNLEIEADPDFPELDPSLKYWAKIKWNPETFVFDVVQAGIGEYQKGVLFGSDPNFDNTARIQEGYWYSRYNLGELVMHSGLGVTFMPDMAKVMQAVAAVDSDPNDGDTAIPPTNPALLKAVYRSGNPAFVNPDNGDPNDFINFRWDEESFDKTVTEEAQGWTMIKEIEWAKLFHFEPHFGSPSSPFGAQQRFAGMVLAMEAQMQAMEWINWATGVGGAVQFESSNVGRYVMLFALSDLADLLNRESVPGSGTNRHRDPQMASMFFSAADSLYEYIVSNLPPSTLKEYSTAAHAFAWYAAFTPNGADRADARVRIGQFGDAIIASEKPRAADKGYAIRGLIEAFRVTGADRFLTAAAGVFNDLDREYMGSYGVFSSQSVYTVEEVGVILGALNALLQKGGGTIDRNGLVNMFNGFFESAVNMGGLQRAAPPVNTVGDFERLRDIDHRYPTTPTPPLAGGKYGVASVFASEITFNNTTKKWLVTNTDFDAAGAMRTSNEELWFHTVYTDAFPEVP